MTGRHSSISGRAEESAGDSGQKPVGAYTKEQYLQNCSVFDRTWEQAIANSVGLPDTGVGSAVTQPRFHLSQQVYFVGGQGTVKYCQPYAQTWAYLVEMELGPEPEMGRIGSEATILLNEAEIYASVDLCLVVS
ncbi:MULTISPECIES: hypothetical protein [Trichocoleus]|uniref:Uncharacterized protein n=1 Tax=Trichocoleus desertorum GB2-A4 TaxID=2933944 RepID=A0ABV0J9B6_9CYAN|nr:hypothetical protein [Trichocoleus sp. FACHB-46]